MSLGFLLLEVFDCQSNANLTKAQSVFASWFPGLRRTFLLAFGVWFHAVVYGSVSAGREKWPFCVICFQKVEPSPD